MILVDQPTEQIPSANVALDGLSAADATYFLFVCLPLAIHGATGSLIRPIAIV